MAIPEDEIERHDWNDVSRRLTDYARWRLGWNANIADAEEIAQEAIRIVLDPDFREFNPAEEDLMWHLQSNVNGIINNRRKKKALAKEQLHDLQPETSDERFHQKNPGVTRVQQRAVLEVLHDYAEARGDEQAQTVVMDALSGDFDDAETATKLNVPVQKIYDTRQRLKRYLAAILREES
jgi:DNA-directed RNA polymerase specialized sigma24 family protein